MNGDERVQTTKDENGVETEVPPKTAQAILARQKERKAKSILLLAISDEYQPRALPSSWNNIALIMRNKEGIDELDIDDLYNNLKVFEANIKGSSGSSSNSQNVDFFSTKDTNRINEVNTGNGVSTAAGHSSSDLEQIDHDDLEEMDLKRQVAMISMRVKQFYKKTGRKLNSNSKEPVALTKPRLNALTVIEEAILQRSVKHQEIKRTGWRCKDNALIFQDGLGYDWSYIAQDETTEFALMAYTLGADTEANLEIIAYQLGLESVKEQLIVHQKNEVVYEEKIAVLEFEVKDKGLDDSVYRPTANKTSAIISKGEASVIKTSKISVEMCKVDSVRTSEVIIEDCVSDDEDIFQSMDSQVDSQTTVKPSIKKIEFTKARIEFVKSDKQADKPKMVTQNYKVDRKDWNGNLTQKLRLGLGFTKKTCFVYGSHNHLIKDCDFYEKRMSKKSVLNDMGKGIGHREVRPNWNNTQRINHQNKFVPTAVLSRSGRIPGNTQQAVKYKGMFESRCSRHMIGNKAFLTDYQDIDGGFVAFGGSTRGGKITSISKIRTNKIDFEDVFFVKELKFNLFSVSKMCDKKNSVLYTETKCLVLSPDFKLIDESQVLLRIPRQNNMYRFDLKNVVPSGDLTCLFVKATIDEPNIWHRRLGHVNFKIMNKLMKGNLVR
nr:ribonuclease H-like domain-containing protein [Tanacetum cinerariifolium]